MALNGWLVIDKPLGITSADVIRILKKLLHPKKIGHAGTLDPLASGMLVIALGEATKAIDFVMQGVKTYEFCVTWGQNRDTIDAEGKILSISPKRPSIDQLKSILNEFTPSYYQTPPKYSAVKMQGRRAYNLARNNIEFELKPKLVELKKIEIINHSSDETSFLIECGKGFYVRSLAQDIADKISMMGYVSRLRRVSCAKFDTTSMISLETLKKLVYNENNCSWDNVIFAITAVLDDILVWQISEDESRRLKFGQKIKVSSQIENQTLITVHLGVPIAICTLNDGILIPNRIFNL